MSKGLGPPPPLPAAARPVRRGPSARPPAPPPFPAAAAQVPAGGGSGGGQRTGGLLVHPPPVVGGRAARAGGRTTGRPRAAVLGTGGAAPCAPLALAALQPRPCMLAGLRPSPPHRTNPEVFPSRSYRQVGRLGGCADGARRHHAQAHTRSPLPTHPHTRCRTTPRALPLPAALPLLCAGGHPGKRGAGEARARLRDRHLPQPAGGAQDARGGQAGLARASVGQGRRRLSSQQPPPRA